MSRSRSWYAAAGIVATAAVIGVIAYLTSVVGDKSTDLGPATDSGTALPTESSRPTRPPRRTRTPSRAAHDLAVYFLGHGPRGDVLYRQTVPVTAGVQPLDAAISALTSDPTTPTTAPAGVPARWSRRRCGTA